MLNIEFKLVHVATFIYLVICDVDVAAASAAAAKNRSLVNECSRIYLFSYLNC
jgi:hypothetical protein